MHSLTCAWHFSHLDPIHQGFPDWPTPDFIKAALKEAVDLDYNQYTRSGGHPPLVKALAERYSPVFDGALGRPIDAMTEVTISVGTAQ
jgi:aspartate/methionine/tyrosine aminotransferase